MSITPLSVLLVILQDQFLNLMTAAAVISAADFERKQNNERRLSLRRFVDRRTQRPTTLLEAWNQIKPSVSPRYHTHTHLMQINTSSIISTMSKVLKYHIQTWNQFPHKCSLYFVFLHCYSLLDTGHGYNTNADRTTAAMQGVGLFFFLPERT